MCLEFNEARITINGHELSPGESMAVRVAVSEMHYRIQADGLGEDPVGKRMAALYAAACTSISRKITAPS